MRRPGWALCLLLGVAFPLTPSTAGEASQGPALEVGRPFPDLFLPSLETGRPVSLAEFRGKKLILQVFASW